MKKILSFILDWVYQFPQMLMGAILVKVLKAKKRIHITNDGRQIEWHCFERNTKFSNYISGVSLSIYIILSDPTDETILHEHGHSTQSLILGWLYLPIIGLWSVSCNLIDRYLHKDWSRYDRIYWYYIICKCERWADKLGKVDRKEVLRKIPRPSDAKYPAMENQKVA